MSDEVTILWPIKTPEGPEEERFCHFYCRKVTRELCLHEPGAVHWQEYRAFETMADIPGKSPTALCLLVTDPKIIVSARAIRRLTQTLKERHADGAAPVYNESSASAQQFPVNPPYVNVTSFLEIEARLGPDQRHPFEADGSIDPGCLLFDKSILSTDKFDRQAVSRLTPHDFVSRLPVPVAVDNTALVHRFGDYSKGQREDLIRLLPDTAVNVLDIGCAMGEYGRRLKELRPGVRLTGVEADSGLARRASLYYDDVINSPIEKARLAGGAFDAVNCGDILEHLQNPWGILSRLNRLLAPGGTLVTSLPNIGHWSIVQDLMKGRFDYIPWGLLCITHIRWFTEASIREALNQAGFTIDRFERQQVAPTPNGKKFISDMVEAGYADETALLTNEFLISAVKASPPCDHPFHLD